MRLGPLSSGDATPISSNAHHYFEGTMNYLSIFKSCRQFAIKKTSQITIRQAIKLSDHLIPGYHMLISITFIYK